MLLMVSAVSGATIAERTKGLEKMAGFVNLYWDAKAGKMFLEIPKLEEEMLYVTSMPAGVGSNDLGLDRGQLGTRGRVVVFERSGNRVLMIEQNYDFRAVSQDADERKSVKDSFGRSALAGFTVEAEEEGRVLVDATSYLLQDAHNVPGLLRARGQGTFRVDPARCAFYLARTKGFPKNTEIEVTLTFAGEGAGPLLQDVVPKPDAMTIRQHHSFIELPDAGFVPRAFDPRSGYFAFDYMDYATPVDEPIRKRFIPRHRLVKKDPNAAVSEPVKPLVYYLDRGAPEPIRSALLEGGRWWAEAFEAAGFQNAFRVEVLPEGADPMDVRYNMIQWVHRSTRGWSYGASVIDPRTGEILKGHVTLGSLRVRQDYLIAEGVLAPYDATAKAKQAMELGLARLRQLSAHEIGHTLGLVHNFAASVSGRASVMDYPGPYVLLKDTGEADLQQAYAVGIGEFDKTAIRYGYSQFAPGVDEREELRKILEESQKKGIVMIADADSADGGAHPSTHVWDNGKNAVEELNRVMKVRAAALARFGENNIRPGTPMATLEEVLVPLYLGHRYQVAAAVKTLGGLNYTYALRGDGQVIAELVPAAAQRSALEALLATITPEALTLPERVLKLIPPRPVGYARDRETFARRTGITFDAVAPAEAAANHVVGLMLHPDRASRLVQYHARESSQPGLAMVIEELLKRTVKSKKPEGVAGEVARAVDVVVVHHLMALASNERAAAGARALAMAYLQSAVPRVPLNPHDGFLSVMIKRFMEDPGKPSLAKPVEMPPGAPI